MPDLYIVSNDSLEKAYLSGLASEIELSEGTQSLPDLFPETAVDAVTYHDKLIGYPFYFETSCFLYNKSYLNDWARAQLEAEADAAMGEEAQAQLEDGQDPEEDTSPEEGETEGAAAAVSDEAVEAKVAETLPKTIDDIRSFADVYDAP